ncbi:MAG: hypothetical protein CMH54_04250 [Myxococcales bacterium]|nr:hypothetical protein [Myxococcales bacterium]
MFDDSGTDGTTSNLEKFEQKGNWPFLLGVYMGINGTRDAYLIIDSPDCAFFKTEHIQGNHDRASDLMDCTGHHRIVNTRADVGNIINDRRTLVQGISQEVYDDPATGGVFVTSMPMAMVTGVEYGLLTRTCQENSEVWKPAAEIPCASLAGDWLDGYADYLTALAGSIEIQENSIKKNTVAIIGNMMDRVEADCLANAAELKCMVEALDLEVISTWLDGGSVADITRASEAEFLVSLPYGREAAKYLSERSGAEVIELDLPFGLEPTERWLRTLGEATGRQAQAETYIEKQLEIVAKRLEWVIPNKLIAKRFVVAADPHLTRGMIDLFREVGADVTLAISYGRKEHLGAESTIEKQGRTRLYHEPPLSRLHAIMTEEFQGSNPPDLLIGNSQAFEASAFEWPTFLEFGYPSYRTSQVFDAPFLGFRGALWFLGEVANRIGLLETMAPFRKKPQTAPEFDVRGLLRKQS